MGEHEDHKVSLLARPAQDREGTASQQPSSGGDISIVGQNKAFLQPLRHSVQTPAHALWSQLQDSLQTPTTEFHAPGDGILLINNCNLLDVSSTGSASCLRTLGISQAHSRQ